MYIDKKILKKNKYIFFNKVVGKQKILLPSLTNGIKWKNSNLFYGSNEFNTLNNESMYKAEMQKIDDNEYDIKLNSLKYRYTIDSKEGFLVVDSHPANNIYYFKPSQKWLDGVTIKTYKPVMFYLAIALEGFLSGGGATPMGFDLYCNNELIYKFDNIRNLPYSYEIVERYTFSWIKGICFYLQPKDGQCFIQVKMNHLFGLKSTVTPGGVLTIGYYDENNQSDTPMNIHCLAYEEK